MELVPREEFLRWAGSVGVRLDPRYAEPRCLNVVPPTEHNRFWVLPPDPASWPNFAVSVLEGLDDWSDGFLWPRSGSWPDPARLASPNDGVRNAILRGAGIPGGRAGAARVGRHEEDALIAVLYAYLAFGWCVEDDLFFVPDHGRQLVQTDHHDVIHVQCNSEERVRKLVAHMADAGYELPREPPDWTFKRPAWMGSAVGATGNDSVASNG
jgi:hypothetical protein